ncbi:T9SS type A sorting domain-containing protein [Chondrinema litorale]|uniref:T9SS type A sorting domain-containing protein n=1 Tax=Chondrinema litorale TaxID=2994555 RepID=UPI0025431723|nr:T9SS type A sorting domain-containing protein [Chondrinema litorale]UZR96761.1 T9SS type A sorting domain-containing protein [Chondrinema litorale]
MPEHAYSNDSIFLIDNNSTVQIDVISQYGCSKSIIVTTPTFTPEELANAGKQGTCILNGFNAFYHILDEEGNMIASINDLGNNLGVITAEVRIDDDVKSHNGEHYMQRNYKITPQFNGQAAKVRLYFTENERTTLKRKRSGSNYDVLINDETSYQVAETNSTNTSQENTMEYTIAKYDGDAPGTANETFLTSQAQSNGFKTERHYVEFTVPSFSSMYLHEQNELLPVQLISFNATVKNQKNALLSWQTASETNNKGFEIQRSGDGYNFESIGFVKGNQNTQTNTSYSFVDENLNGLYYYRLKQIDKDNSIFYSRVVKVRIERQDELSVIAFPNTLQDKLQLSVNNAVGTKINISIINAEGKIAMKKQHASDALNTKYTIDVASLQSGIYFVKVSTIDQSSTIKVVKN